VAKTKIYKKIVVDDENVYEAARRRFIELFDRFDKVVVSFSGGKDSTVCLNLALEVAEQMGKLPLDVYFWDEEAIHPETIEYVERVRRDPRVRFKWLCIPIKHRNACSRKEPYWYPWNPADKDKWVRPMPEGAITEMEGFYWGAGVPEIAHLVYPKSCGSIADVRGIRADESLRRYRSVAMKKHDNWINAPRDGYSFPCSPIYDWTSFDVWVAPQRFGWDYNRTYDIMRLAGMTLNDQRVCPPYGEEPLSGLWIYAQCWPEMWHKMIARVPGAATAGRYATTELYGYGKLSKPPGTTWREWAYRQLDLYPAAYRKIIAANLVALIREHKSKSNRPIPEDQADPLTGLSWKFLAMIVNRGDLKGRRSRTMNKLATDARTKKKLTLTDVTEQDLGTRY
jgi:predicted phosphoadenosine phosphosulfate sulfurtransferase